MNMKQGRINQFFKVLPDQTSENLQNIVNSNGSTGSTKCLNDSDLVPATPEASSKKKNYSRSFLASNNSKSTTPARSSKPVKKNSKISSKTTPKAANCQSTNQVKEITNVSKAASHLNEFIIDDDDDDVFEAPPNAKRRDIKPSPNKHLLQTTGSDINSEGLNKEQDFRDKSFKNIVSKYRTRMPQTLSASNISPEMDQKCDSNLDDMILEIQKDQHSSNNQSNNSITSIGSLQNVGNVVSVKRNKFKRSSSGLKTPLQMKSSCGDADDSLDDILSMLNEDQKKIDSPIFNPNRYQSIAKNIEKVEVLNKDDNIDDNQGDNNDDDGRNNLVELDQHLTNESTFSNKTNAETIPNFDDFDDDDVDFEAMMEVPTTEENPLFHKYGRHKVLSVHRDKRHLMLRLQCAVSGVYRDAILTGFWADTLVDVDDWVNILGGFDDQNQCVVSDDCNLIVVNPDLLVTGTAVSTSTHCMRKVVLNDKFKYTTAIKSHNLIYGTAIHSVFQEVLKKRITTAEDMKIVVDGVLKSYELVRTMYGQNASETEMRCEIEKYLSQLKEFVDTYTRFGKVTQQHHHHNFTGVRGPLNPIQRFPSNHSKPQSVKNPPELVIDDIIDIEENVWCPRLGIKGKIDVTASVKLHKRPTKSIIPIELKTGKTSFSADHTGQVMLYSMMLDYLADEESSLKDFTKEEENVGGLLVYLKNCSSKFISTKRVAVCGLIQLRNRLAFHMSETSKRSSYKEGGRGGLPEVIYDERSCSSCDQKLNCCLYQRCFEKTSPPEGHPMSSILPATLSHLNDEHVDFFYLQCLALHLEEAVEKRNVTRANISDVWLRPAHKRVEEGLCLRNLTLRSSESNKSNSKEEFRAKFECTKSIEINASEGSIAEGDRIIISEDGCDRTGRSLRVALSVGTLTTIDGKVIEVVTDGDLSRHLIQNGGNSMQTFRMDKVDSFSSLPLNLSNLSRLMFNEPVSERLRSLIIDRRPAGFMSTLPKMWIPMIQPYLKDSNKPQKSAILKSLLCEDYVLIKGFPGTGKTTTIATLIQILTRLGFSVLLASYTHSAIDNVLIKLVEKGVDILRLGKSEKRVHPKILPFLDLNLTQNITSAEELKQFYDSKSVIATTCLGINHPVLHRRKFDYCIVDEASQSLLVSCVGPLLSASKFVLVGDPDQLPPVVQDGEARTIGLGKSLFEHLDGNGSTFELSLQYRMNREIVRMCNELIYNGRLLCGNDSVAEAKLQIPSLTPTFKQLMSQLPAWTSKCFDPNEEVTWLDMSGVENDVTENQVTENDVTKNQVTRSEVTRNEVTRSEVSNDEEASIVVLLVLLFLKAGIPADNIGIISPFRSQVSLLKRRLNSIDSTNHHHGLNMDDVEVNTIDQYQGRDKEVVMVSFARRERKDSLKRDVKGSDILSDKRRLNVALTRGKFKVILIGDTVHLTSYQPIKCLLNEILRPNQISTVESMAGVRGALQLALQCK